MTSGERKTIPRVIEEETQLWGEISERARVFFSSVSYSSFLKRGKTDVGIALNLGDEERFFRIVQSKVGCGQTTWKLCCEELPDQCLVVVFESPEPYDFKLLRVRLVKEEAQDENSLGARLPL